MARWAKISERIGQDAQLAVLAEVPETRLAALLFTWSFAAADLYGILPADPREYAGRVCPAARGLSDSQIEQAIKQQEDAGLILTYNGDRPLLYIIHYHKYQDVRWQRTGAPEYKLPPSWQIPDELRQWLETDKCPRSAEFYGIFDQIQETPGDSREIPPRRRLDVDVDTDTDVKGLGPDGPDIPPVNEPSTTGQPPDYDPAQHEHAILCNESELVAAVRQAKPSWGMPVLNAFVTSLLQLGINDEAHPEVTHASVMAALADPKLAPANRWADDWIKLLEKHFRLESARASPRTQVDAELRHAETQAQTRIRRLGNVMPLATRFLHETGDAEAARVRLLEALPDDAELFDGAIATAQQAMEASDE